MTRLECDIKAQVKKIIQGNEQRKRRVANGTASKFDIMAAGVPISQNRTHGRKSINRYIKALHRIYRMKALWALCAAAVNSTITERNL